MVFDVAVGQFAQQNVHFVVQSGVVCGCPHDESAIAEHVANDVRMMCFRHVMHHNVLHTGLTGCPSNNFGHAFCIAIHRSVADNKSVFGLVFAHAVVQFHHLLQLFVPHGAVCRADIVYLFVG